MPPTRSSPARAENTRSTPRPEIPSILQQLSASALPPMSETRGPPPQLSGSAPQRLTRAPAPPNPFLVRRPMPFGTSLQRIETNLPTPNPIQRMKVPLPSAQTPIRKQQRDTPRSDAKTTARVMAISDLLNPVTDREVEMGMVGSSELAAEQRSNLSSEGSRVLLPFSPTPAVAETPEVETMGRLSGACSGELGSQTNLPVQKNATGFPCPACGSIYQHKWSLRQHQSDPGVCAPLKCTRCTRKFASQEILAAHVCVVNERARCPVCKVVFASTGCLKRHLEKKHVPKEPRFPCPACKKDISTRRAWEIHRASKTACKPFKCERCARPFRTQKLLEKHISGMHPG